MREAIAAAETVSREVPWDMVPRRAGDPAVRAAASELARRELGWTPRYPSLREIIETPGTDIAIRTSEGVRRAWNGSEGFRGALPILRWRAGATGHTAARGYAYVRSLRGTNPVRSPNTAPIASSVAAVGLLAPDSICRKACTLMPR